MWRFIFIAFLVAHGLIHIAMWVVVPKPVPGKVTSFDASHSWLLGDRRALAATMAAATAVVLVTAGIGLWADADWWRAATVVGLAASFLLMVIYFNPWFLFIEGVNAAIIGSLLWLNWPSQTMVGA